MAERTTGVFGLSKVRLNQGQNVSSNNLDSWPENSEYGYFGGGYVSTSMSRIDFSTFSQISPGNYMPPYQLISTL